MCGVGVVCWSGGWGLTLPLEGLIVRLLQPLLLPHVVAAGLQECGKDDRAADGARVGNILTVRAVEAALVAACGVDVGEEALVGVLVAEGPLPAAIVGHERMQPRVRALCSLTHMPGG